MVFKWFTLFHNLQRCHKNNRQDGVGNTTQQRNLEIIKKNEKFSFLCKTMVNQFVKWFVEEVARRVNEQNEELQRLKQIEENFNRILKLSRNICHDGNLEWLSICTCCGYSYIETWQYEQSFQCADCGVCVCDECMFTIHDKDDDGFYSYCKDCYLKITWNGPSNHNSKHPD